MTRQPLFVLARTGDLYHVRIIARDVAPEAGRPGAIRVEIDDPRHSPAEGWVLQSPAAALLYIALTGHRYGDDPDDAEAMSARTARAILATLREPGYYLASRIVNHFGEIILPGLGQRQARPERVEL